MSKANWKLIQAYVGAGVDGDPGPETARKIIAKFGIEKPKPTLPELVKGSDRDVNRLIIHCSATPEGREVTSEEIGRWHKARNFSNRGGTYVGYHYLIHLDGTIEACKPEGVRGTHAYPWNTASMAICYIGGVAKDGRTPKDTRTDAQKASMEKLAKAIVEAYDIDDNEVYGHRDVPRVAKACPSFDVKAWWASICQSCEHG